MKNEFLQQTVNAMNEIAIVSRTDHQGVITFVNENFCKISGYSEAELIGKNHSIVNSGFHSKHFFQQMWKDISALKPWHGLIRNKAQSGDFYWVDTYIVPFVDEKNKVSEFISFRFDVTAEKLAEADLEKEKMKNIHMSRLSSIGEMAAHVAHKINNHLAVLQGHLFLIERHLKKVELSEVPIEKMNESIQKSFLQVKRMTEIVNGLREFSRSNEEQIYQTVSCSKMIQTVQELCADKIKKNKIKFEVSLSEIELICSQVQIEQVLIQLIQNAVDAIAPLEEKWVRIESVLKGHFVEISVTDSGRGISKELAQKIMQPFFTTQEVGKGTGLGLCISKDMIEAHGGTLKIDTESLHTKFVIQLPIDEKALISLIDQDEAVQSHLLKSKDKACHLGIWIQRVSKRFKDDALFLDLQAAHSEFHRNQVEVMSQDQNQKLNLLSERVVFSLQKLINEKVSVSNF
jgi:PAS domain S-box-containing protein